MKRNKTNKTLKNLLQTKEHKKGAPAMSAGVAPTMPAGVAPAVSAGVAPAMPAGVVPAMPAGVAPAVSAGVVPASVAPLATSAPSAISAPSATSATSATSAPSATLATPASSEPDKVDTPLSALFDDMESDFIEEGRIYLDWDEEYKLIKQWREKLALSEKVYAPYFELVKKIRKAYKANATYENGYFKGTRSSYNIFWAGIETQKPFLYFTRPKPYLARANKVADKAEQLASQILERALEWDLNRFDFDSVIKYARNDYLISGCGILWESYCPVFKEVVLENGETLSLKTSETVESKYIDPTLLLIDTNHVGIFEEASFVARKLYMDKEELEKTFGACNVSFITNYLTDETESVLVYEIWDKTTKRVYWLAPSFSAHFLKVLSDPLHLTGFFPCPKPIYATLTNDSLIPIPDYVMIEKMLDELNGVTDRMRLIMQALKVSGVYDNSFTRLESILSKDVTLVGLSDFDRLKEAGGIKGVIDFIPIEQYIIALQALTAQRDTIVQRIYEISGISDIMRGNSNQAETATAVIKKTNFGTLRNQDRQNDMQRFIANAYQIKAELICALFDEETLLSFLTPLEKEDMALAHKAVDLLKNEKMRGMILHIETDAVLDSDTLAEKTLKGINAISDMILKGMGVVSTQPLLLGLYKQMIMALVGQMPQARTFESILDQTFSAIEKELNTPSDETGANSFYLSALRANANKERLEMLQQKLAEQKALMDYEIESEKNRLKEKELAIKSIESQAKLAKTLQETTNKNTDLIIEAPSKAIVLETKDKDLLAPSDATMVATLPRRL